MASLLSRRGGHTVRASNLLLYPSEIRAMESNCIPPIGRVGTTNMSRIPSERALSNAPLRLSTLMPSFFSILSITIGLVNALYTR